MEFITALYNEEKEIPSLLAHVYPQVSHLNIVDDGSTDGTVALIKAFPDPDNKIRLEVVEHTGHPEYGFERAQAMADDDWIILLAADERFILSTVKKIKQFVEVPNQYSYVWFTLSEYIDNNLTRTFQKCRLFRKGAAKFPCCIHTGEIYHGEGYTPNDWVVEHRKTRGKQVLREAEYLLTYKKLLAEGKIDQDSYNWMVSLHYFIKE